MTHEKICCFHPKKTKIGRKLTKMWFCEFPYRESTRKKLRKWKNLNRRWPISEIFTVFIWDQEELKFWFRAHSEGSPIFLKFTLRKWKNLNGWWPSCNIFLYTLPDQGEPKFCFWAHSEGSHFQIFFDFLTFSKLPKMKKSKPSMAHL